jgi:hypothetical protein
MVTGHEHKFASGNVLACRLVRPGIREYTIKSCKLGRDYECFKKDKIAYATRHHRTEG